MTEIETMALSYMLEFANEVPPDQWNLSPEIKEWVREILMKLDNTCKLIETE